MSQPTTPCPTCSQPLKRVRQPLGSLLNSDQFDAIRAGDWYCTTCENQDTNSGYRYFWDNDLIIPSDDVELDAIEKIFQSCECKLKCSLERRPDQWCQPVRNVVAEDQGYVNTTNPYMYDAARIYMRAQITMLRKLTVTQSMDLYPGDDQVSK